MEVIQCSPLKRTFYFMLNVRNKRRAALMSWKDVGNRVVDKSVEHYNYFWTVISTLVLNLIKLKLFYNFET